MLYHDLEGVTMMQYDYTDSWIHEIFSGGIAEESFPSLEQYLTYICPIGEEIKGENNNMKRVNY